VNISFDLNANGGRFVNFVNDEKNISNNTQAGIGISFSRYKENKFNFWVREMATRNWSKSSISTQASQNFWQHEINADFDYYITKRLVIGGNGTAYLREKVDAFDMNNNMVIWNGNVVYKIFPKRNGEFKFEALDILNQRRGIERFFNANSFVEKNYQVLGQYFMLSFTWNFTKTPGAETPAPKK
jgi:hypothetical protein